MWNTYRPKKAFDTINNQILYGIHGNASGFFNSSELTENSMCTSMELKDVICGVPRGSVLGPIVNLLMIWLIHLKTYFFSLLVTPASITKQIPLKKLRIKSMIS